METEGVFSRILVPTDFSRGSERAWSIAQRVAKNLGAELVLLHVLPASPLDEDKILREEERKAELRALQADHQLGIPRAYEDTAPRAVFEGPPNDDFSAAGRAWAAELERWADAARDNGCKVRTVLRVGVPYREVIMSAGEEEADLVLMATHGRGEIQRLLLGSVADKVVRMAPCPVLTVKQAA